MRNALAGGCAVCSVSSGISASGPTPSHLALSHSRTPPPGCCFTCLTIPQPAIDVTRPRPLPTKRLAALPRPLRRRNLARLPVCSLITHCCPAQAANILSAPHPCPAVHNARTRLQAARSPHHSMTTSLPRHSTKSTPPCTRCPPTAYKQKLSRGARSDPSASLVSPPS